MTDVVLTGFMGTGKSTVGRLLAGRLGLQFVDLDDEIVERTGKTIPALFAEWGEPGFRRAEAEIWRDLMQGEGRAIATGGGTLLSEANRSLLAGRPAFCLVASPEELVRRLAGTTGRPLLPTADLATISRVLEERQPAYSLFSQIRTDGRAAEAVADEIATAAGLETVGRLNWASESECVVNLRRGALDKLGEELKALGIAGRSLVVTDQTVAGLGYADRVVHSLCPEPVGVVALPAGEDTKTLETVAQLYEQCMECGLDRGSVIVAVGGGVAGDIAGLVAATYLRGIALVQVPTTLLAQVDASIGGKVGVDFGGVKNLVGAFHPARLVLIDPDTLGTLPVPALSDGLAEVVKIAAVCSDRLWTMVETLDAATEVVERADIVRRAACEKLAVVARDPFESGERALLNFGHTVGHALEAASGYRLSHGRAVAIGMMAEAQLGVELGLCNAIVVARLREVLDRLGLPLLARDLDPARAWPALSHDKKRAEGELRIAIPTEIGRGVVRHVGSADLHRAVERAVERAA